MGFVRLDRAGFPFIGGALAVGLIAGALGGWVAATPFLVLAAFFVFFFRDPDRLASDERDTAVLSPADGRVLVAGPAVPEAAPPGQWQQISVFLSPMDVHI